MKKILLLVASLFSVATSFAQLDLPTPDWTKDVTGAVEEASDASRYAPIAITNEGDVIKTGTFTQTIKFASKELEPIAKSAYILKYDKDGNEVWGNTLRGAATVTAITTDETGNIFVAGRFADKVIITSTDGQTAEIDGMAENTEQVSGFIVAYDKDGKLLARRLFVPSLDPELEATFSYYPEKGDVYFRINNIKVANEKVYITANYTGVNKIDNVQLVGRALGIDFGGGFMMYMDRNSAAALSFDKNLTGAELVADVKTTAPVVDSHMGVHDINLAVDGENVYVAWTGIGNLSMTTEKETKDFTFESGSHPFVVANVTAGQTKAFEAPEVATDVNFYTVAGMQVDGTKLYIGGTYIGALAFDNTKTSTGACDAFLAALNTSDLSVAWAETSGLDEGAANKVNEKATCLWVYESKVSLLIDAIDMSSSTPLVTCLFAINADGTEKTGFRIPQFLPSYVAASTAGVAVNMNSGLASNLWYFADKTATGLETLENERNASSGLIFNMQGQRVNKAQHGVFVKNGKKVVVK